MELPASFTSLKDKLLEFLEVSSLIVCEVFRELPLLCTFVINFFGIFYFVFDLIAKFFLHLSNPMGH